MLDLHHEPMSPIFDKWHVGGMPRPAVFHRFTAADSGDPHDHPFPFISTIIDGGYVEAVYALDGSSRTIERKVGDSFTVTADHVHQIVGLPTGECWTLILPQGPKVQEPGFWRWENGQPWRRAWNGEWKAMA